MKRVIAAVYRVRGGVYYAAVAVLLVVVVAGQRLDSDLARRVSAVLAVAGVATIVVCVLLSVSATKILPVRETMVVRSPVRGRWLALNSPATKVPSHGVRAYGQAYAIDLVHEPGDIARPGTAKGLGMRKPAEYPAFGQPVLAMIDGTVARASDWRRDHRSRSNPLALVYVMIEGIVREIGGPGFVAGNHVTIRGANDVYASVAHVQRGSVPVRVGDTVRAGDQIARCGNSGNSTEPHVHAQLMDRASLWTGQGMPLAFAEITLGDADEPMDTVPANGQHMTRRDPTAAAEM